ncbi:hypothetical protein NKI77_14225 [Mesorhizobium opportunistum]|uniref:Uncharacterized protein n=1 Tax=Mesorhizobium opportunistum TaxID=593909 RepID=A0ABV1YFW6_9HYPH|nr:hypothetical protein [Mesorhizobium sp.]TIN93308.1 MAG: hypothetical protein E5Y06_20435 [Mesorhizobium sp.]TJU95571.1 MAG: hypothetical protein E5Y08_24870 [Mesorhizobium sp.]TJV17553.1 MAG: hypothetical protein E5Y07_13340 [Mesorhizobium sp.]
MYLKSAFVIALLFSTVAPAFSQYVDENGRFRRPGDDGLAKVQSSLTMSIPVKDGEDIAAQQQAGLRSFYKVAASSCAMVLESIADSCEVTSVTTNVNARDRSMGAAAGSQITVTGQIAMKVKFKASLGKPAP